MNILLFIALFTLFGNGGAKPVPVAEDCKKMVIEAYSRIAEAQQGNVAKPQLLEYKTTTFYKVAGEKQLKSSVSTTKMFSNGTQAYFNNEEAEIAKDKHTVVTVLKKQRQIFVTDAASPIGMSNAQLEAVRSMLLEHAQLTACQLADGGKTNLVSFKLSEQLASRYQIKSMKFWVADGGKQVKKIELQYTAGQAVERHTVEFLNHQFDVHPIKKFKKPIDIIKDTKGMLLPVYKGYRLTDTRSAK